jgi:hypothetical protein
MIEAPCGPKPARLLARPHDSEEHGCGHDEQVQVSSPQLSVRKGGASAAVAFIASARLPRSTVTRQINHLPPEAQCRQTGQPRTARFGTFRPGRTIKSHVRRVDFACLLRTDA